MTALLRMLASASALVLAALGCQAQETPPMQYRFAVERGIPVIWLQGPIGPNSARHVEHGLRQRARYQEVWLDSGGGLVSEGVAIGRLLQSLRATVRVPAATDVQCASSCTILMLGGHNRIVEEGAQFLVHAPSSAMNVSGPGQPVYVTENGRGYAIEAGRLIGIAQQEPETFRDVIGLVHAASARSAVETLMYYQSILGGTPQREAYAGLDAPALPSVYAKPPGSQGARVLATDIAALRSDGVIALQEILTQTELNAMRGVLQAARLQEPQLGRGARVAARLLEGMLACRIQDVCLLSRHQLANLGYHNFDKD